MTVKDLRLLAKEALGIGFPSKTTKSEMIHTILVESNK